MQKLFTLILGLFVISNLSYGQVYLDQFDDDNNDFAGGAAVFATSEADGEWTINGTATGPWDVFTYAIHEGASGTTVDASGNNKVFVKAKASNVGTQLRMDVMDADGYVTSLAAITKTLTTEYTILEFDFSGNYQDGGYGGTSCDAADAPCPVDATTISQLQFFVDPGIGGFNGTVVIDYVAFGEAPEEIEVSDVFQDHFDDPNALGAFTFVAEGFTVGQDGSEVTISGDGTMGPYDPLTYVFINPATGDTIDIDVTAGNNKMFLKAKSSIENTALRMDLQDIDSYVNTQGSITKLLSTEYQVFEFDFTGTFIDLGYGGTPCTPETAPCPVDATRIADILFFVEPGVGEFIGDITIDYISFGTSLEAAGPEPELVYGDHFNNEVIEWTGDIPGFTVSETNSEWTISGDGSSGPYSAISYQFHDKSSGEVIALDFGPANNKVFLKAKAGSGTVPLRMDLLDTLGYTTSQGALTKIINDDYVTYEFDFTSANIDGGYGGTPCEVGPCVVDLSIINQVLIYADPVQGGYTGEVIIDFLSVGKPLEEDTGTGPVGFINYADQMDINTSLFTTDMTGFSSTFGDDEWTITGDGTSGAYTPTNYELHNDAGEPVLADAVGSNNKLFVKAKSSVDGTQLRIDVQDNQGFVSNLNAVAVDLTTEYAVYELDYTGSYEDGGYGGSDCTSDTAPCPVDGSRIADLQLFVNADAGAFDGTVTIDWISFGVELMEDVDTMGSGIQNIDLLSNINAYPNPANDVLNIDLDLVQAGNVEVLIYDVVGRVVALKDLGFTNEGTAKNILDVSDLNKGLYFISIQIDEVQSATFKFNKF